MQRRVCLDKSVPQKSSHLFRLDDGHGIGVLIVARVQNLVGAKITTEHVDLESAIQQSPSRFGVSGSVSQPMRAYA